MTFQSDGQKVRLSVNGVSTDGKLINDDNSILWDGKFYAANGPMGPGRVAVKRLNDHQNRVTIEAGGKKVLTINSVVSKDGKTMTNVGDGVSPKGEKTHFVEVLEKQ
jgi:flagellar hook assembly protein FlgD